MSDKPKAKGLTEHQALGRALGSAKAHGLDKEEFFKRLHKAGVVPTVESVVDSSGKKEMTYSAAQVVTSCIAYLKELKHDDCAAGLQREWDSVAPAA